MVDRDEREEGDLRAMLNFGHTIAHAIETVAGYDGPFRHGEAVAVGMVAESRLAAAAGLGHRRSGRPPGPAARALRAPGPGARARSAATASRR